MHRGGGAFRLHLFFSTPPPVWAETAALCLQHDTGTNTVPLDLDTKCYKTSCHRFFSLCHWHMWVHISTLLMFQVKMWKLDGAELFSSTTRDEGLVVLGVLQESVVSLSDSGLVTIRHPVDGTQTVETQLENPQRRLTVVNSVSLPKRGKVFMVSKEGFLFQVPALYLSTSSWTKYYYHQSTISIIILLLYYS